MGKDPRLGGLGLRASPSPRTRSSSAQAFALVLHRPPDDEARERALAKLADGTLSRATLLHELAAAPEVDRIRDARRRRRVGRSRPVRAASVRGC